MQSSLDDAMDIDELVLNEVVNLRASHWKSTSEQVISASGGPHKAGIEYFIVLDSNVLISYLPLLRDLLSTVQEQRLKMALCLPAVVIQELNYLKEKNGNPNTRALAQVANVWLLSQMRQRHGILRGQQKHEKASVEGDIDGVNDDKIVDYCQYLLTGTSRLDAVTLLSNDQNCCLKAEIQGLMDVDDDGYISPSSSHPLSVLHRQLIEYLTPLLQQLSFDAALKEQEQRKQAGNPSSSSSSTGKASIYSSIHAPKKADPQVIRRAFVMPTPEDVQAWSASDCILFSLEFPSISDEERTKPNNRSQPTVSKLGLFLLPHDKPGGRKGKDWSIGDWKMALDELDKVAAYCGTLVVLSSVSFYLHIDPPAYLEDEEIFRLERFYDDNRTSRADEKIPRIIHQTWKTDVLPDRWRIVAQGCRDLMSDYDYKLWTDESSRTFIEEHYPWFLDTYDGYTYPIQRADSIRYFVLHHFGGVYMDLDVGCMRRMDPLLQYEVILPKTIPVGVSNDLMFSAKGHPFMEQTIRHLVNFDYSWILNYPTVMFSTGPMFLSAQYGIYTAAHPPTPSNPGGDVRILPKSLYGKNARVDEAPNAFFSHHYGSSWHADDAAFITFLGRSGMHLMWIGFFILIAGVIRLLLQRRSPVKGRSLRRRLASARYYLLLPRRVPSQDGNVTLDILGPTADSGSTTTDTTPISTPPSSRPSSPSSTMPLLPYSFDASGTASTSSNAEQTQRSLGSSAAGAIRRAGAWARSQMPGSQPPRGHHDRSRSSWGGASDMLFFLPAILTNQPSASTSSPSHRTRARSSSPSHSYPPSKSTTTNPNDDIEAAAGVRSVASPPPPYGAPTPLRSPLDEDDWSDWSASGPSTSSSVSLASSGNHPP
ncbi:hypothetical protein FRC17_002726 [Serendipita sp. 399]|nr:hypothetical protein FRC17_002726 [Serendipita sp. 399]